MDANLDLAQATIIGGIIEHPEQAANVFATVRIEDFDNQYRLIAESIHGLRLSKTPINSLAVIDEMTRRGTIGRIGGMAEVMRVAGFGFGSVDYSVDILARTARLRRLQTSALRNQQLSEQPDADPHAIARLMIEQGQSILDQIESEGDITTPTIGEFLAVEDSPFDWVIPGLLERADRLILTGSEGLGKALALDTPVLTVDGWADMGSLKVGDRVFGPDGTPATIVAATEVMTGRPCYRVTFSDGSQIVADERHLWLTETLKSREATARAARRRSTKPRGTDQRHKRAHFPAVITTGEMFATQRVRGSVANHSIDVCAPLQWPEATLPVHPYILGAWLGDGTSRGSGFTCADQAIIDEIAKHEPVRKRSGRYQWSISDGHKGSRSSLTTRLRALGVLGNKHIPGLYLQGSVEQRLELLRGLMDTDGTVTASTNSHVCEFTATSEGLATGVLELALSLGINASLREGVATLNGRTIGPKWRVTFTTATRVFHLPRKAQRQVPSTTTRATKRYVVDVAPVESVPVRCIQVDREDGLFLAGERLITTHNSVLFRQLAVAAASGIHPFTHQPIPQQRVLYVDCENSPSQLRKALRPLVAQGRRFGNDPDASLFIEARPEGLDLTRPEDETWLVKRVSALQPALLLTGPLYRLHAKNPNDEEPARQVARVLDRCRAAANCALVVEAHAGHGFGAGSERPVRPTGTSLWLRWPEFGYGLRATDDYDPRNRVVNFVSWRGDRAERDWPTQLRSGGTWPWERVIQHNEHHYQEAG